MADYTTLLKEELNKRIPFYQQESEDLGQFLNAAGEMLQELRESIDRFQSYYDYDQDSIERLSRLSQHFRIDFPTDISEDILRVAVRDIVSIYQQKGTERTLEWILRVMGFGFTIRYAWVLNPETFTAPSEVTDTTFIYGTENLYQNGVYFDGEDAFGNQYNKVPIIGERYGNNKTLNDDVVAKLPYVFVEIDTDSYQAVFDEQGVNNSQSVEEILEDYIAKVRPANVRVVLVVTFPDFQDLIDYHPDDEQTLEMDHELLVDGSFAVGVDAYNPWTTNEYYGNFTVGGGADLVYYRSREEFDAPPFDILDRTYPSGTNPDRRIGVRSHSVIDVDIGTNASVDLYGTQDERDVEFPSYSLIKTIQSNEVLKLEDYKVIYFEGDSGGTLTDDLTIRNIDYSPFVRIIGTFRFPHLMNFQRASNGSYFNASGQLVEAGSDELREEYDPYTGDKIGFLIEKDSENLITYASELTQWSVGALGLVEEDILEELPFYNGNFYRVINTSSTDSESSIYQTVSISENNYYTFSTHAKAGSGPVSFGVVVNGYSSVVLFDTSNKTFSVLNGGGGLPELNYRYFQVANDTFRVSMVFSAPSGSTQAETHLYANYDQAGVGEYTLFWGAQFEMMYGDTSYIDTQGSTRTRAKDNLKFENMTNALPPASSMIVQFAKGYFDNATLTDLVSQDQNLRAYSQNNELYFNGSLALQWQLSDINKVALTWESGSQRAFVNGSKVFDDPHTESPSAYDTLYVGQDQNETDQLNGHIQEIFVYPRSVDDIIGIGETQ